MRTSLVTRQEKEEERREEKGEKKNYHSQVPYQIPHCLSIHPCRRVIEQRAPHAQQ